MPMIFQLLIGLMLVVPAWIFARNAWINVAAVAAGRRAQGDVLDLLAPIVDDPAVPARVKEFCAHLAVLAVNDDALMVLLDMPTNRQGNDTSRELLKDAGKHRDPLRKAVFMVAMMALAHDPHHGRAVRKELRRDKCNDPGPTLPTVKKDARRMASAVTRSIEMELQAA